jgi:hypothetical protein
MERWADWLVDSRSDYKVPWAYTIERRTPPSAALSTSAANAEQRSATLQEIAILYTIE